MIRHLLLKVNSPSLEDSLLLVESREAKKAPQDEEKSQEKPKTSSVESNDNNESNANEELKDGE